MKKILKTPLYNLIFQDYIGETSKLDGFIDPPKRVSWEDKITSINPASSRYQQVKRILARQNADLISDKAKIYIDSLEHPETVVLITGQQLGLFASPIYTLYKIITTIKLAESLNKREGHYHYVPVFWLETEDHDFQEINHIGLLDKKFQSIQLTYNGEDRGKVSLRHYQIEPSITSFISDVEENLLETEFSEDLFNNIRAYYAPSQGWTSAVRRFLNEIFEAYGLLFFHPGDEEIKKISIDFFTDLLLKGKEIRAAFDRQSRRLIEEGYQNQVKNIPGQTFIHIEQENYQREHLHKEEEKYYYKGSGKNYTQKEVFDLIKSNPTNVSSTVVSRPLLQSWLLPVVAYVAGPGEIAYWAQLGGMFPIFDLTMPILYPRISATVIEPKISRYIDKYSPEVEYMALKKNMFIATYFKNLGENKGDDPFSNLRDRIENEGQKIEDYLKSLDPTLVDSGKKSIERIKQTLENLENRVIRVKEQKESQLTAHLEQIHTAIFPHESPQERFLSVIYFLNKFGPAFITELYDGLELDNFEHQLLYLS